jgi:hypothetical protein
MRDLERGLGNLANSSLALVSFFHKNVCFQRLFKLRQKPGGFKVESATRRLKAHAQFMVHCGKERFLLLENVESCCFVFRFLA